jgi:hypothetical protein
MAPGANTGVQKHSFVLDCTKLKQILEKLKLQYKNYRYYIRKQSTRSTNTRSNISLKPCKFHIGPFSSETHKTKLLNFSPPELFFFKSSKSINKHAILFFDSLSYLVW